MLKTHMERISKPNLVDLLRLADRQKWFCPRIRFASVRSKPQLIEDLRGWFRDMKPGHLIHFVPHDRGPLGGRLPAHVPKIRYHVKNRTFLLDGRRIDVPKLSRAKPSFAIRHNVYVEFQRSPGASESRPAKPATAAAADWSEVLGTRARPNC